MYSQEKIKEAYDGIILALNRLEDPLPVDMNSQFVGSLKVADARFMCAPKLINVLLWKGKITIEQHENMHSMLLSEDFENWQVVFTLIQTLYKDE
jgi:hypothetical protein